ncbi:MAG: hypothetical protein NZ888_06650 [Candidatus Nitrosocaldus sp.]|nr:hypothetical protein [Candidatus Nitrosocaldus sp.]MDW8000552.1 hypothetical protein [Candidatus Nitrosocaldus sp.]
MNRIRRIAMQLLERYDGMFTADFESNKELLDKIAVFRSKELRNEVAGYITRHIMRRSHAGQPTTTDTTSMGEDVEQVKAESAVEE